MHRFTDKRKKQPNNQSSGQMQNPISSSLGPILQDIHFPDLLVLRIGERGRQLNMRCSSTQLYATRSGDVR